MWKIKITSNRWNNEVKGDKHYNCAQENWQAPTGFQPDKMQKIKEDGKAVTKSTYFNQNQFFSPQNQTHT